MDDIELTDGNVYVIKKFEKEKLDLENCEIKEFERYFVIEK